MKRTKQLKFVSCAVAASAIALAPLIARADDATTTTTTSTATTTTDTTMATAPAVDMSMTPTLVTGTVLRYYVDRSGYVTAMDIQTPTGVSMVRFSPDMGQRLYTSAPVGGQASVYVVGSPTTSWDVVGMGTTAPTVMPTPWVSDVELLDSEPYIMLGARTMSVTGSLTDIITNRRGEVVGLVLDHTTLIRVPREVRNVAPGEVGGPRISPLFKGAIVEATGFQEAPRYGVLSAFTSRLAARSLVVSGKVVSAVGIQNMSRSESESVFNNVDIGGNTRTPEEVRAMGMGYNVYTPAGSTMMMNSAAGTTASGTGATTTTGTTAPATQ